MTDKRIVPKVIFTAIYSVGCACVAGYGLLYLQHSTEIPNPEAMLPMMEYERAVWCLILGVPFMALSCLSVVLAYQTKKGIKRAATWLPVMVCLVIIAHYFVAG